MIERSRAEHVVPRHTWSMPYDPVLTLAARDGGGWSFFRGQGRLWLSSLTTIVEHLHYTRGYVEADERGTFWRGITLDMDTRLRVGRAIGKTEEHLAHDLMLQLKDRGHPEAPPAMATDGKG